MILGIIPAFVPPTAVALVVLAWLIVRFRLASDPWVRS